jgi:peptidoglycan/xylan/chitin deacetylase (PgdA/CDA1 family)
MIRLLLFHRVLPKAPISRTTYPLEAFEALLASLHTTLIPPEKSAVFSIDTALSFDDATVDFYHYVFPLLQKYRRKALLAIPTKFIKESHTESIQKRLTAMPFQDMASFCSWKEIKEMVKSGWVIPLSHSHSHIVLPEANNLEEELSLSKSILENALHHPIEGIAFPYGKWNSKVLSHAKKYYRYFFRIGSAYNISWHNRSYLTYRIPIETVPKNQPIQPLLRLIGATIRNK